jgi:hypothetical protein
VLQPDEGGGTAAQGRESDNGLGGQGDEMAKFQKYIHLYKIFV